MNTIDILRKIVAERQHQEIDGVIVDMQSANVIVTVYDALNDTNKAKLIAMPIEKMASVAWKMVK